MRAFNSSIRIKEGQCTFPGCRYRGPLIGKMCQNHYNLSSKLRSAHKQDQKEIAAEDGMPELVERLDGLVSKFVRMSAADEFKMAECFTCRMRELWTKLDAGHYISRSCMYLRFDADRNIRPQCYNCNRVNYGLQAEFGRRLELENPGITEILLEESGIIHKWTRTELNEMIADFHKRIKQLK